MPKSRDSALEVEKSDFPTADRPLSSTRVIIQAAQHHDLQIQEPQNRRKAEKLRQFGLIAYPFTFTVASRWER
jgi:hypothetical protein